MCIRDLRDALSFIIPNKRNDSEFAHWIVSRPIYNRILFSICVAIIGVIVGLSLIYFVDIFSNLF